MKDDYLCERIQAHLLESARVKRRAAGVEADAVGRGEVFAAATAVGAPAIATPGHELQGKVSESVRGADNKLVVSIVAAARAVADAFSSGGKLLLCGNGGSAADCQHMAAEFTGLLSKDFDRPGLPAIALTTDSSFLTAYANDVRFEEVFARQVQALGKRGDVLIAISTSGNSKNVLVAIEAARSAGLRTIALSGMGGCLKDMADIAIAIPSTNTHHIQEAHLAIEHAICGAVEWSLFGKGEG